MSVAAVGGGRGECNHAMRVFAVFDFFCLLFSYAFCSGDDVVDGAPNEASRTMFSPRVLVPPMKVGRLCSSQMTGGGVVVDDRISEEKFRTNERKNVPPFS